MSFNILFVISLVASTLGAIIQQRATTCGDGSVVKNAQCCAFTALRDDLLKNLYNAGCTEEVHETLRLAFHDAIAFSPTKGGGGADGSMIIFPNVEPNFVPNQGIAAPVGDLTPFFHSHNVTAGDLIQFAAAVAITQCPGAPRLSFLSGRPNAKAPAPDGLIPEPTQNVATIVARFHDAAGFTSDEVVALLASHSIARADHVDPTIQAVPFDSTPFVMDTQFFVDVQLRGVGFPGTGGNSGEVESPLPQGTTADPGEMRLQSDSNFARDPSTACTFQSFVNNQAAMQTKFAAAMEKLALTGQNSAGFIDCSDAVPPASTVPVKAVKFPAGKTRADIEQACASTPFPTLSADTGPATDIPHCPTTEPDC